MRRHAIIEDGKYRYLLTRVWDEKLHMLVVCMLNPSTANAIEDDPTIRKLIKFAKSWGFGGLFVVNLYAYRSSKPLKITQENHAARKGSRNEFYIDMALKYARGTNGWALAAWGNGGGLDNSFAQQAKNYDVWLACLGETSSGAPKHPLARGKHFIPADQQPMPYRY